MTLLLFGKLVERHGSCVLRLMGGSSRARVRVNVWVHRIKPYIRECAHTSILTHIYQNTSALTNTHLPTRCAWKPDRLAKSGVPQRYSCLYPLFMWLAVPRNLSSGGSYWNHLSHPLIHHSFWPPHWMQLSGHFLMSEDSSEKVELEVQPIFFGAAAPETLSIIYILLLCFAIFYFFFEGGYFGKSHQHWRKERGC